MRFEVLELWWSAKNDRAVPDARDTVVATNKFKQKGPTQGRVRKRATRYFIIRDCSCEHPCSSVGSLCWQHTQRYKAGNKPLHRKCWNSFKHCFWETYASPSYTFHERELSFRVVVGRTARDTYPAGSQFFFSLYTIFFVLSHVFRPLTLFYLIFAFCGWLQQNKLNTRSGGIEQRKKKLESSGNTLAQRQKAERPFGQILERRREEVKLV